MRPDFRDRGGLPPLPKPYDFVEFPRTRPDRRSPADQAAGGGHDRFAAGRLSGTVEGTLVALSPVHVASGNIELTGGQPALVRAHFRRGDRPAIPGSSLKGAVRSIVEAISQPPSCVRVTQARRDNLPSHVQPCRDREELCLACRLFGALGYLGRVRFHDALLEGGGTRTIRIPQLFQPRSRERVYLQGQVVRGRKFYQHGFENGEPARGNGPIEVCPRDARFPLRMDFENLSRAEIGLLLVALGQGEPPLFPKLGGGKPACCGSVRVEIAAVRTTAGAALEFDPSDREEDVAALARERSLVDEETYASLREILKFPGDRACPDRNY